MRMRGPWKNEEMLAREALPPSFSPSFTQFIAETHLWTDAWRRGGLLARGRRGGHPARGGRRAHVYICHRCNCRGAVRGPSLAHAASFILERSGRMSRDRRGIVQIQILSCLLLWQQSGSGVQEFSWLLGGPRFPDAHACLECFVGANGRPHFLESLSFPPRPRVRPRPC